MRRPPPRRTSPVLPVLLIAGAGVAGGLISVSPNSSTTPAGSSQPASTDPIRDSALTSVDLGAPSRCDCKLIEATNYGQPNGCRLKSRPQLVELEGYLKADAVPADLPKPPWRVQELEQTGPKTWDPVPGTHAAQTKVHVLQADLTSEFSPLKGRLQVRDAGSDTAPPFWIRIEDFDPVAWWSCPVDKAVVHSMVIAEPRGNARPTTIEGRWIESNYRGSLWCFTWVRDVGVYCLPPMSKRSSSFDPWIYKPDELAITY